MNRLITCAIVSTAFALAVAPLQAETARTRAVSRTGPSAQARSMRIGPSDATAATYSAQVNIVTRIQGTSFFKTAIDITNNTDVDGVTAIFQYCYTLNGNFQGCTAQQSINLLAFDNFHTDDIVQYLGTLGVLAPGAEQQSFGTFLVTFDNLPSNFGWEGTVTARTYSPYDQADLSKGTVASAYPGSLFFESASGSLVATIRDTIADPTDAGALRTNLGITNTGLNNTDPVTVDLSFYDVTPGSPTNGQRVGDILTVANLAAGEVRQINNVFPTAHIPSGIDSCIAFADVTSPTNGLATIEGYITILDNGTRDSAYFEMKCAAGCGP
jgi:hypothetical protein